MSLGLSRCFLPQLPNGWESAAPVVKAALKGRSCTPCSYCAQGRPLWGSCQNQQGQELILASSGLCVPQCVTLAQGALGSSCLWLKCRKYLQEVRRGVSNTLLGVAKENLLQTGHSGDTTYFLVTGVTPRFPLELLVVVPCTELEEGMLRWWHCKEPCGGSCSLSLGVV